MMTPREQILAHFDHVDAKTEMIVDGVLSSVFSFWKMKQTIEEEYHNGAGTPKLFPSVRPLISIGKIEKETDTKREDITNSVKMVARSSMLVMRSGVFPRGYENIRIKYTAGYETMPHDLIGAIIAKSQHLLHEMKAGNIKSESIDDYKVEFNHDAPSEAEKIFIKYQQKWYV